MQATINTMFVNEDIQNKFIWSILTMKHEPTCIFRGLLWQKPGTPPDPLKDSTVGRGTWISTYIAFSCNYTISILTSILVCTQPNIIICVSITDPEIEDSK